MIQVSELGPLGSHIGRGGSAVVYKVDYRMPNDPRPLVFKELKPDTELKAGGFSRGTLVKDMKNSVQARMSLSPQDRKDLDETAAWPLDLVQDGGRVVGLVMPLIPADYFIATHQQGQPPGRAPRDLALMSADDAWARRMGVDRSAFTDPFDRVLILINLVYAVARLHKHRIVYGDLSLKNVLFSPTTHNIFLLDCDSTASLDDPHRSHQAHSPYFKPPEIANKTRRLQDTRTDVYKLALCIVRGLQPPSRNAMHATDPDTLVPLLGVAIVADLRRALDPDPNKRPTAKDLLQLLTGHYDSHAPLPVIRRFEALRSEDEVRLIWYVSRLDRCSGTVRLPDDTVHHVDLAAGEARFSVPLAGKFRLEVTNPWGAVTASEAPEMRMPRPALRILEPEEDLF